MNHGVKTWGMQLNNLQAPCSECGELESHKLHHEIESPMPMAGHSQFDHFDECNYEADWQGEERGWVPSMLCHEYELGCYCGERGRCEVCIDQAMDHADYLRDAAKEG